MSYARPQAANQKRWKTKLPFSLESEHTPETFATFAIERCGDFPETRDVALNLTGMAMHYLHLGELDRTHDLLNELRWADSDATGDTAVAALRVAAYLARAGDKERAQEHLDRIWDRAGGLRSRIVMGWVCAVEHFTLGPKSERVALANATPMAPIPASELAHSYAIVGDWDGAFEALSLAVGKDWRGLRPLLALAKEARDLDRIEQLLSWGREREWMDGRLFATAASAALEAGDPARAWAFRDHFDGYSTSQQDLRILQAVFESEGSAAVRTLLQTRLVPSDKGRYGVVAAGLQTWATVDPEGAKPEILACLDIVELPSLVDWDQVEFVQSMAEVLVMVGETDRLETLLETVDLAKHPSACLTLLRVINPAHPLWEPAMRVATNSGPLRVLKAIGAHAEPYDEVFAQVLSDAGTDEYKLRRLLETVCELGDWEAANRVRMNRPKAKRPELSQVMGSNAIRLGHISCAMAMGGELRPERQGSWALAQLVANSGTSAIKDRIV